MRILLQKSLIFSATALDYTQFHFNNDGISHEAERMDQYRLKRDTIFANEKIKRSQMVREATDDAKRIFGELISESRDMAIASSNLEDDFDGEDQDTDSGEDLMQKIRLWKAAQELAVDALRRTLKIGVTVPSNPAEPRRTPPNPAEPKKSKKSSRRTQKIRQN